MDDRYGTDVLGAGWRQQHVRPLAEVEATKDLVVEVAADGYCGAVVGVSSGMVEIEDRHGRRRLFPLGPGCLLDGADGLLVPPSAAPSGADRRRTASGSFATADARARTARA